MRTKSFKNLQKLGILLFLTFLLAGCMGGRSTYSIASHDKIQKQNRTKEEIAASIEEDFRFKLHTQSFLYAQDESRSYLQNMLNNNTYFMREIIYKNSRRKYERHEMVTDYRGYQNTTSIDSFYIVKAHNEKMPYNEAKNYCEQLTANGYSKWSLPKNGSFFVKDDSVVDTVYLFLNRETDGSYLPFYNDLAEHDSPYANYVKRANNGEESTFLCVKKIPYKPTNYKDFRVTIAGLYYMGENPETTISLTGQNRGIYTSYTEEQVAKRYTVKQKTGTLNELLYTKNVFTELQRVTQRLTDLYLAPREILKIPAPLLIKKPEAPKIPKFVKGEFETKKQFQERVNETLAQREKQIKELQKKYREDVEARNKIVQKNTELYALEIENVKQEQAYKKSVLKQKIQEFQEAAFKMITGGFEFEKRSYDAESNTLYLTVKAKRANFNKKISLHISPAQAQTFVADIKNVQSKVAFDFANNQVTLKAIDAVSASGTYAAVLDEKDFQPEKMVIVTNTKKVEFDSAQQMRLDLQNPNLKDTYQIEALAYKDGIQMKGSVNSSYNDDIPGLLSNAAQAKIDKRKWLFIIGIEKYAETDDIAFSTRSAIEFKKVAQKTLGVTDRNTYMLLDNEATSGRIKNKLQLMLSEIKKGDTIYFYYNGHGIPDPKKDSEPYMLPSDMIPDFITSEKEFALKNIYQKLSNSNASQVVGFIDSCFSGATDGTSIIKGVAASRLAPKKVTFNKNKMVILTAGQKKQYSNMYKEKGHRMFSYYLMKSLLKGKKDINSIYKEVSYKVSEQSNELGALKKQEPTIDGNTKIKL